VGFPHQNPHWTRALQLAGGHKGRSPIGSELSHEIQPVVVVEDLSASLDPTNSPRQAMGTGGVTSTANIPKVQLFNPAGSSVAGDVFGAWISLSAAPVDIIFLFANVVLPTSIGASGQLINRTIPIPGVGVSSAPSACQFFTDTGGAALGTIFNRIFVSLTTVNWIPFPRPVTIGPGGGITVAGNANSTLSLQVSMAWQERAIVQRA
jgi:hypothetical protein